MKQQRLLRLEKLIGEKNIEKLQASTVMLVGLGGVGGTAFEALLRSGIGHFILIDSESFDETNLNRQILCTRATIGKLKTEVAKERAMSIDENIIVETFPVFADETNILSLLDKNPSVVVDAIDSVPSKVFLLSSCVKREIPVVSSMGAGLRVDPTLVRISDIGQTFCDPLAKEVRRRLKEEEILSGIKCVFSTEKPKEKVGAIIASSCTVTSTFGNALAQAAIDTLLQN